MPFTTPLYSQIFKQPEASAHTNSSPLFYGPDGQGILRDLQALISYINALPGGGVAGVTGNIVDNTDPANPIVTQVQPDWDAVSGLGEILNKPSLPASTIIFADEATAQAAIGTFVTPENGGGLYVIKDIGQAQALQNVDYQGYAISADELSPACSAMFQNIVMLAESIDPLPMDIEYDLATGKVKYAKYVVNNVIVHDVIQGGVANWCFTPTYNLQHDLLLNDAILLASDITSAVTNSTFGPFSVIAIDNGSTVSNATVGAEAEFTIGASTACIFSGDVGESATLIMYDTHNFTSCTLGPGKTIDLTTIPAGYTQTGKSYTDNGSTFVWGTVVDLAGATIIDTTLINGTMNLSFCGKFIFENSSGTPAVIERITASQDHSLIFNFSFNTGNIGFVSGANNINLSGGISITMQTQRDRAGFSFRDGADEWIQNGDTFILTP